MPDLERALREQFGFDSFRPNQREVIEHLLAARHTLAVLPTGLGKSLCYQLPAQLMPGLALVISPLIALMQDQVEALRRRGFRNVTSLSSALSPAEVGRRLGEIETGQHKLVYVAPERFDSPRFQQLVRQSELSLVVIDEAHCISQWGHDFRPHYRTLLARLPELRRATFLAVTATATLEVQNDIAATLSLPSLERVIADFDRPNLRLETIKADQREDKDNQLIEMLKHESGAAIVYASTRKEATTAHQLLLQSGIDATLYHAGLGTGQRVEAQQRFLQDECRVIVATVAFGLGIDKPNVRRVIHYNVPGSLENYYQEAGRAGRDGDAAICTLFYSQSDVRTQRFLLDQAYPESKVVGQIYGVLREAAPLAIAVGDLATASGTPEITVNAALQLLHEQGRIALTADGKYAMPEQADADWKLDVRELNARRFRANERLKQMVAYALDPKCRRAAILGYFGQRFSPPCGACDVCDAKTFEHPLPLKVIARETPNHKARLILQTVAELKGRFGRTLVVELLTGSKRKRIFELGLDRSPNYGALSACRQDQVFAWVDSLVAQQLLQVTAEEYPRLLITEAGCRRLEPEVQAPSAAQEQNASVVTEGEVLFSETVTAAEKTYRIGVEQAADGSRCLVIAEEPATEPVGTIQRMVISESDAEEFSRSLKTALQLLGLEQSQARKRQDEIKRQYKKAYEKWEPEEDRALKRGFKDGVSINRLAATFQRQPGAIRSRLTKLGLLHPDGREDN